MDEKWTPGPWSIRNGEFAYKMIVIARGNPDPIAVVYGGIGDVESGANTRLIAAAPDLYEALATMVEYLSAPLPPTNKQMVLEPARSALAKARGE